MVYLTKIKKKVCRRKKDTNQAKWYILKSVLKLLDLDDFDRASLGCVDRDLQFNIFLIKDNLPRTIRALSATFEVDFTIRSNLPEVRLQSSTCESADTCLAIEGDTIFCHNESRIKGCL